MRIKIREIPPQKEDFTCYVFVLTDGELLLLFHLLYFVLLAILITSKQSVVMKH